MEEIVFIEDRAHLAHPFFNKQLVFTGALSTMTRSQAAKRVHACGARLQGAVTHHTDFLIIGDRARGISSKHVKAKQLIALGADLQIVSEQDFLWLLELT